MSTPDYGLRITAPPHPRQPYAPWSPTIPEAEYRCRCGATATATGADQVQTLVTQWDTHLQVCPARPERPCQGCGTPTRILSSGASGWPTCPACRTAWADRPVEQRRRRHQADRIAAREAQRAKARRLREQLQRQGYAPDVIDLIVADMAGA
jgi:hypothetical protein